VSVVDRRGVELKVGQVAVHATGGRYGSYDVVRVAELRKRVRVDRIDYLGRGAVHEPAAAQWLEAGTLIVVDRLPYVEGRLNTTPACQFCSRPDRHSHAAD
jgi:hypothetical protein